MCMGMQPACAVGCLYLDVCLCMCACASACERKERARASASLRIRGGRNTQQGRAYIRPRAETATRKRAVRKRFKWERAKRERG
jgi:hypothetical protein